MSKKRIIIICLVICGIIGFIFYKYNDYRVGKEIRHAVFCDNVRREFFGRGSAYAYDNYVNDDTDRMKNIDKIYPYTLKAMYLWRDEGIQAITQWTDEEYMRILEVAKEYETDPKYNLAIQILNNNYNVLDDSYLDENGNKVYVDFMEFYHALSDVEDFAGWEDRSICYKFKDRVDDYRDAEQIK